MNENPSLLFTLQIARSIRSPVGSCAHVGPGYLAAATEAGLMDVLVAAANHAGPRAEDCAKRILKVGGGWAGVRTGRLQLVLVPPALLRVVSRFFPVTWHSVPAGSDQSCLVSGPAGLQCRDGRSCARHRRTRWCRRHCATHA